MNRVIDLRAYVDACVCPTLLLVDMQQEYVSCERMLSIANVSGVLEHCRAALTHARAEGFPVAFTRLHGRSALFNRATEFVGWIPGFEPTASDMIFDRNRPSCYASAHFAEVMNYSAGNFVMAGFSGETACLATAMDAHHRHHTFAFLHDASASHSIGKISTEHVHGTVTEIIGLYGDVASTAEWIDAMHEANRHIRGDRWTTFQDR